MNDRIAQRHTSYRTWLCQMDGSGQNGSGAAHDSTSSGRSRAERFEDEKRRIVDSCFARKEEDGSCMIDPE